MAIVTLAFRAEDVPALAGSGFLVPPIDGRTIKAATFSFAKWDWVREAGDGVLLLRTSVGRHREESVLQVPDEELVAASLADLADATGLTARPSTRSCSAGAAGCRSTPWATSTGWRGSTRPWRWFPGWRSAGRRTTASASPP